MSIAIPEVGARRDEILVEDLTRTRIVQYAGASGDYNPLHTDEVFAREIGRFPGVFAHGMLTMGLTARLLTDWFGAGSLRTYGVRFVAQVWPGETLRGEGVVTAVRPVEGGSEVDVELTTTNDSGKTVLTGTATAYVRTSND